MNERDIKAIKWEKDKEYSIGNGLFLRVRQYSKTFIIRKKHKGKRTPRQIYLYLKSQAL